MKNKSRLATLAAVALTAMAALQLLKIVDLFLPFFSGTQYSGIVKSNIGTAVLAIIVGIPLFLAFLFAALASWESLKEENDTLSLHKATYAPKALSLFSTFKLIDSMVLVFVMILLFSGTVASAGAGFATHFKSILGFYNWDFMGLWSTITGALNGGISKLNQPITVLFRLVIMLLVLANAVVVMMTWKSIAACQDEIIKTKENPEAKLNVKPPVVLPLVVGGINAFCGLFLVIDMFVALATKGSLGLGITGLMMLATAGYLISTALIFKNTEYTPVVTEASIKSNAFSQDNTDAE